ncbi:hypothetical protein C8Q69DRAFT_460109 [Paecilomyces variotii]|uniref:Uncharacterized protein n=1 Tax=Byssochlamys spectabilis TaxID=264951 RepID=A0A443I417_BYSSP|nr:hypothetical protein C8Q69DRAFT_460109 [Paecilomyces variotii]RWQ98767.1 hypothetical protein C8Q69DRAFT_460109 [Paecilomyces variotii]
MGNLLHNLLNMQCVPHRAIWEFYLPSKCYSLPKVMLASVSIQVITDIIQWCPCRKELSGLST